MIQWNGTDERCAYPILRSSLPVIAIHAARPVLYSRFRSGSDVRILRTVQSGRAPTKEGTWQTW